MIRIFRSLLLLCSCVLVVRCINIVANQGPSSPFPVATVLNLTCEGGSNITWSSDCPMKSCFAYIDDTSATISTTDRAGVKALTSVDVGTYTCSAIVNGSMVNTTFRVTLSTGVGVFEQPSLTTVLNNTYYTANSDGQFPSIDLHCIGSDGPGDWDDPYGDEIESGLFSTYDDADGSNVLFLNKTTYGSGSGLTIANDTLEFDMTREGFYTCSMLDETIRIGLFLFGRAPPNIGGIFVSQNPVLLNTTITLNCSAEANPAPTFTWSLNGTILSSYNTSTISITLTNSSSYGDYTCTADNMVGSDTAVVAIKQAILPYLVSDLANITGISPSNVTLICNVSGYPLLSVMWYRMGTELMTKRTVNSNSIVAIYTIENSQANDTGLYQCIANSGSFNKTFNVHVDILVVPTIASMNDTYSVNENSSVSFQCTATGIPPPIITWYRNGALITDERFNMTSDDTLTLTNAYSTDSNTYSCNATNTAGTIGTQFELIVYFGTRLEYFPEDQIVIEYNSISFICNASGLERPTIKWTFNGNQLSNGNDLTIMDTEIQTTTLTSTLTLSNVSRNQTGEYECIGSNQLKSDIGKFNLTVNFIPDVITAPVSLTVIQPNRAVFTCTGNGLPRPSIQWVYNNTTTLQSSNGYMITSTTDSLTQITSHLTINSSDPSYTGTYHCVISNDVSSVDVSAELTVNVEPTIASMNDTYSVNENSSVSFQCTATGIPPPIVTWYRNGAPITDERFNMTSDNNTLTLTNAYSTDSNTYSCNATNNAGTIGTQFELIVYFGTRLEYFPEDQIVIEYNNISFICSASGLERPTISWTFNGNQLSNGSGLTIMDTKIQTTTLTSTLTLSNVNRSQIGEYECIGSNQLKTDSRKFNLAVNFIPDVITAPVSLTVIQPNRAEFNCTGNGLPRPSIQWVYNNDNTSLQSSNGYMITSTTDSLTQITSHLTINSSDPSYTGIYHCVIFNDVSSVNVSAELTVNVEPTIASMNDTYSVNENSSVSFQCTATGIPPPIITWYRNGTLIADERFINSSYNVPLSDNNLIHQVISTLNLTTSADDDSGNNSYLCRADNIAGSISDTFSLDVFVAPVIFYPPNNVTVVQPNQTTLTCNASGHPRPEIAWYRQTESTNGVTEQVTANVSNVHIGSRILYSVLSIEQTNPSDAGNYTCEASNRVITHNSTAIITVHVKPTILSPLQQTTFYVNESDYISITCSVIGLPPASITWMKDSLLLNNDDTSPNITLSINSTFNYTELATGLIYQTNQTLTLLANGSDTGSYSCVGTNAVANITTQFNIFVQVLPEVVFLNKSRVIGEVNSTILLSFALYNAAPPVDISNIRWRFSADFSNDPYTGSQDITDLMSRDSFSTYIFSSDKLSLSIIGINQMDEGRYYLIATNPAGTRFNYIDFIVHGPPRIIKRPTDATVINTNDATFDCLAVADPYHHIYWTFDGQPLANTRDKINITTKYSLNSDNTSLTEYGKLTIYNVTYDDRGTYECNATNYVGNVIADAVLTVHVRPVVHDISQSSSLLISESLSLGCLATGFPLPKIRWIKNGINLLNSTNVTTETIPVDNQLLSSFNWTNVPGNVMTLGSIGRLTFTNVARNDTANYTCEAVNSLPTSTELSAISHPITITVLERPDPPVNVVVTGYTSRTVNVSWTNGFDGNSKIKGYFVYQKDLDRNGEFIYVHSSGPHSYTAETETSTVITSGIIPYTKYQFTVVACNGVDGSNCSNFDKGIPSIPVRIEPDAPDSPPYNCTAFANSSTSISLSWFTPVEPNGLITNYTITYTPIHSISGINYTNSSSTMASTDPSNDTAITIDNLLKATSYSFTLIAYTVVGPSPSADDICFLYTLQDSPDRSPVDFRGHSGSSTSVSLYWSHPDPFYTNGIITQYRIRYAANLFAPLNQWTYMTTTNNDTNIIIDGLQKFYTYYFVIAAGTVIGFGPDTDNIPIKTLNDTSSPPQSLQLVGSPTQRSISISWGHPSELNGIITAYRVYYQPSKSYQLSDPNFNSSEAVITMGPSITSATLTNLYPSSTYNMSVTAINGAGESSRSISLSAITPPSPPDAVDSLTIPVDGIGGQTVRIELVKPSTINGQISHYHIVAVILDDSTGSLPPDSPDVQFSSINSFISYEDALTTELVNVAYITAEFGESLFPSDNTYIIGDPNQPNDRQYTNQPLRYGTKFTFFLRAYPLLNNNNILKRQLDARQYSVFTSSGYISNPIQTVGDPGPPAAGAIVTILLIIIIIITVAIIVVLIVYKRRKGTFTPRTREQQSELLSMKSDLSLPSIPNPAYQDTSDVQSIGSFPQYEGHPPVPVGEFAKIVDRLHANENYMFSQEYDQICHTSPQPSCDVCLNPMNKLRNRYANIQAYDHSRVKLTPVEDFPHDYINANFINGYNRNNEYIATQGPLPDTVGDFWRMVWDYKSPTIIMLTNLVEKMRVKCSQYWPDNVGSTDEYGCIMVTLTKLITHADYTIRDFEIQAKDSKEIHVVKQYHYTSWPDFGVPRHPTPVIQFIHTIRRHHKPNDARPVIVHCSAGVGRTGTLMTIDVEMQRLENEAEVNPFQFVMSMRQDRNHMVQTEGQYVFIHDAIIEILTTGRTDVNSEQLEDRIQELQDENEEGETGFNLEFKRLIIDKGQFNDFTAARNDANKFKNRLHNTIPYDHNRVKLTKKPGEIGSDYINASYIDGYKAKNVFIATQGPMKNTLDDFWKMIYEQQVSIIVMMTKLEEKGQNFCTQYWPELVGTSSTFGSATVELTKMTTFEYYICRELNLTYKTRDNTDSRVVYQFHYTEWPRTGVPEQAEGLIDLIDQVNRKQHSAGNKPIVVHCNAGVGRTGTFIAMSIAIERIKTEQLVNIFNIVKHLRTQRPNMVQTLEQYMFVYKATSEYVQSFSNYANFTTVI